MRRIQKEATPTDGFALADIECELQAYNPAVVGGVILFTGLAVIGLSVAVWSLIAFCKIAGSTRRILKPG